MTDPMILAEREWAHGDRTRVELLVLGPRGVVSCVGDTREDALAWLAGGERPSARSAAPDASPRGHHASVCAECSDALTRSNGGGLTPRQRRALELRAAGETCATIGQALHVTRSQANVIVHQGLDRLRGGV